MIIRNIRKSDYKSVDALLLQLHQLDLSCRPDLFSAQDSYITFDSFCNLLANKNIIPILAQQGHTILGCCFASIFKSNSDSTKIIYIDLLVVDEQYRHQGIGRLLFQDVQKRAKKNHADRIELVVWSHNPIAEHAYRSYGMTPQRTIYELQLS